MKTVCGVWSVFPVSKSMSSCCGVSSGTGQHQEGGARGGPLLCHCGDQSPLQTEDPGLCIWWCEGAELDRPHQDAPALWGEVWRGRFPLHWDCEVWGGLDGLCPALQRLPAVVSRGAAAGEQPLSTGHWLTGLPAHAWKYDKSSPGGDESWTKR